MKSSVIIILSLLLVTTILAPSIIMLSNINEKAITIDFNEEENKEAKEKDFFLNSNLSFLTNLEGEKTSISCFYIEGVYTASLAITPPPPELVL